MIKICFCGDFVSKEPEMLTISKDIGSIFNNSDILACNFEAPLRANGEAIYKSGPSIFQSDNAPAVLEKIGFNLIQLANNHIFDFSKAGYTATANSFKNAIIIGAGIFEDAYKIKTITIQNKKIGFLSLTHCEFGTLGLNSNVNDFGTAWINHPRVNKIIEEGKKTVDYLFILPHAGIEDIDAPLPEWRMRYKEFIDLGADGVIASHPHVPQGWEEYKGKQIFYSLGNLYFDSTGKHGEYWNKSLVVEINIDDQGELNYVVHNIKFGNNSISFDNSHEIKKHNKYLCQLLSDQEQYVKYINKTVLALFDEYKLYFLRGLGAASFNVKFVTMLHSSYTMLFKKPATQLLINNLQCESHRWCILRALELYTKHK